MSSNETRRLSSVRTNEVVMVRGSNAEIIIDGSVYSGAKVVAQGSNATIKIKGYIWDATVLAQGSNATIEYCGADSRAKIKAQGSNSEVIDKSVIPEYDFADEAPVSPRPPRPPKPPKPPRPPRSQMPSSAKRGVYVDRWKGSSISYENGTLKLDGQEVLSGVKPSDVPPSAPHGTLSVQKSQRPRESWGT